jgi:transposase
MRVVGLDVSRTLVEVAYLEDGRVRSGGRVSVARAALESFARSLRPDDEVVLEATGNTAAIVTTVKPHVRRVVVANPLQVRLIAEARVKTDKIDAAILAQLYASGFLPEVWIPDEATQVLRRQVAPLSDSSPARSAEERDSLGARYPSDRQVSGGRSVWQERPRVARLPAPTAR